jgi:hypothetical protein
MSYVVTKRLRIEGFIVIDHFDKFPAFLAEVGPWVRDGKVAYRETVVEGLERAPEALLGLLTGENIGKMLVKIGRTHEPALQALRPQGSEVAVVLPHRAVPALRALRRARAVEVAAGYASIAARSDAT